MIRKVKCYSCKKYHETTEDALKCCPEKVKIEKCAIYICPNCRSEYDNEDDAIDCCDTEKVQGFRCINCGGIFRLESNAKMCGCGAEFEYTCEKCGKQSRKKFICCEDVK